MAKPSQELNEKLVREVVASQAGARHGPKEERLLNLLLSGTSKGQGGGSTGRSQNDPEMESIIRELLRAGML
jgi:hypothetical protein